MATPSIPSVLTDQQTAETVMNTLQALQLDELNLKMARVRAGGDGSGPSGVFDKDGNPVSIDDRAETIAAQQRSLAEEFKDVLPQVKQMADDRAAAQEAAAKSS